MASSDPAAFCDAVRHRLAGSLGLYCGSRAVGEELAQEALVRAWERWATVGQMVSPEAWTFRTGMNLANSWLRRRTAERRAHDRAGPPVNASEDDATTTTAVRLAVHSLPDRQRAVVIARYFLDLSVEDTAALLDCAPGTVKATTHQALARLRTSGLVNDEELEEIT